VNGIFVLVILNIAMYSKHLLATFV
jgi:hypothetical protein